MEPVEPFNLSINPDNIKGDWVLVEYKKERFLGKVICVKDNEVQVWCLQKPYDIHEPQEFKREEHAIFYKRVFNANEHPKMIKKGRKWFGHIKNNHAVLLCTETRKQKI